MKGKCMSKAGVQSKQWGTVMTKLRPHDQVHVHGLAVLAHEAIGESLSDLETRLLMLRANTICFGLVQGEMVVGAAVLHMGHLAIRVMNVMVHPDWRRQGIGSRLINEIDGMMLESQRIVEFYVHEENLAMQLFLRHNRIRASEVLGDCYLFRAEKGYSKTVGDAKSA